jgi:rod shape determining protein RodA
MLSLLKRTDWKLYTAVAVLLAAGLGSLLSTQQELFGRQLVWICAGAVLMLLLLFADLRSFFSSKNVIYGAYWLVNGLLALTLFIAPEIKGNRAWIVIGSFQFQPAEFAKIAVILLLAFYFSRKHIGIARMRTLLGSFVYAAIPAGLIMLQPDLGSALVILGIWFGFVLLSGIPIKKLLLTLIVFAAVFGIAWQFGFEQYQKDRVLAVFVPSEDPLGRGYNAIQSKIAIGSGGFFGKGFGQGTQVQLGFLPEAQTDFIFSAIAEEGGLFAAWIVILAEFFLVFRLIREGAVLEGNFAKLSALGAAVLFFLQAALNIGSAVGAAPVIGMTLPFVSYGGSSIIANLMLVGIIQSLYARK